MANQTASSLWSQDALDEAWEKYLSREAFTYDAAADPVYRQYEKLYREQGSRAMEDTLGKATALTGGYGNSYAQTAGQQTYQAYMQQLQGTIPDLYENARKQYEAEGEALYDEIVLRQKALAQKTATASGGSGGSGYNNSGYSADVVKAAQRAVGAEADGMWGSASAQKALECGFTSLKQVVEYGLNLSYDYVKKASQKQLGHDRGVVTEMDFLVSRNNDGAGDEFLKYKNYQEYLMDRLRQIYQ